MVEKLTQAGQAPHTGRFKPRMEPGASAHIPAPSTGPQTTVWGTPPHGGVPGLTPVLGRDISSGNGPTTAQARHPTHPQRPWTAGHQASLSSTISRSLLKFMSIA